MAVLLAAGAGTAVAIDGGKQAGPPGDGTSITPVGWSVTPAGQQTTLGSLPTASALSPDGRPAEGRASAGRGTGSRLYMRGAISVLCGPSQRVVANLTFVRWGRVGRGRAWEITSHRRITSFRGAGRSASGSAGTLW